MQTLISVFDNRGDASKAVDRLEEAGFPPECIHLREGEENREIGERTMRTAEREVAVDRGVLDSIGHFFVSLFGEDDGRATAGPYRRSIARGHSVVVVDAPADDEAETAAVILHDCGAIEVDDREAIPGEPVRPGVRSYKREEPEPPGHGGNQPADRAGQDRAGQDRAGQEMKEDREERAWAAPMTHVDRDRPK